MINGAVPEDELDVVRKEAETSQEEYQAPREAADTPLGNVISFIPSFANYLADQRVLAVTNALLGQHVRISQTEYKIRPTRTEIPEMQRATMSRQYELNRAYHSDFSHDLNQKWHISQPFPNAVMGITTLWMLSPFSIANGGTWIVPKSHLNIKNPRGKNDGVGEHPPIPNEIQVTGNAGSVLVMDSRIWHSNAANPSDKPRIAVVVRYVPWWLNLEFFCAPTGVNQATIPSDVFDSLPKEVKVLYDHRVESRESAIWD